jgi:signal transduction histidine kinase
MSDSGWSRASQRNGILWGLLWGIGVGVVEYLAVEPINDWGSVQQLVFWLIHFLMPFWCLVGWLFVWLADNHDRFGHRGLLLAAFTSLSVTASIAQPLLSVLLVHLTRYWFPELERSAAEAGATVPDWNNWITISLLQLWATMFYGALLVAARLFTQRAENASRMLHRSAMARSRTEALLDGARLQALQSQIDPRLLLDSMQELEHRYRSNPERAERLLERLVDFLRCAMHGLRAPVSTLRAELQLAQAFSQLQRERAAGSAWKIDDDSVPDAQSPCFPSLLMLPLLLLGGNSGRPLLRIRHENGQAILSLHGLVENISPELRQQTRSRLYSLYAERYRFECVSAVPQQLRITIPLVPTPLGETYV